MQPFTTGRIKCEIMDGVKMVMEPLLLND